MNLFFLSRDPKNCAEQHCDKHVVKMILEYGQLLSTAHRMLDGQHVEAQIQLSNGKYKRVETWVLPGETAIPKLIPATPEKKETARFEILDAKCYAVAHRYHPLNHWLKASSGNYKFLYELFVWLCTEYTERYGKTHSAQWLAPQLNQLPKNIPEGAFEDPPLSMPDEYKVDDAVISYQNLYVGSKARFAKWTNRKPPEWFIQRTPDYDQAHFERTR